MEMNLHGKVALITGGGRGLGRVIALTFAKAGADLVLISRSQEALEFVAAEAEKLGRKVLFQAGHATEEETVKKLVNNAIDKFGKIDVLVNNVGIAGPIAPITDISLAGWEETIAINLTSYFLFCKYVIPIMKKQQSGSIINISSLAGLKGHINRTPYCASKWAILGMNRAIAMEVGPDNIRSNVVCPGAVAGERFTGILHQRAKDHGVTFDEMVKITSKDTPLRRLIDPEEIAATVLFLASDAASGISGEEILVSGGRR
ncbi:MAG: SDR family NAD(P)-dependent oxidoreductase [bacterium]|jgi:NAD(P)-dependent dehydrogenase (short-subunit alcohol dehydrogenase family)